MRRQWPEMAAGAVSAFGATSGAGTGHCPPAPVFVAWRPMPGALACRRPAPWPAGARRPGLPAPGALACRRPAPWRRSIAWAPIAAPIDRLAWPGLAWPGWLGLVASGLGAVPPVPRASGASGAASHARARLGPGARAWARLRATRATRALRRARPGASARRAHIREGSGFCLKGKSGPGRFPLENQNLRNDSHWLCFAELRYAALGSARLSSAPLCCATIFRGLGEHPRGPRMLTQA
jgi:hypothetical protein